VGGHKALYTLIDIEDEGKAKAAIGILAPLVKKIVK